ncbi:hypothetical protein EDI_038400 [Entamoeba dispar SAW760]|uniref:Ras-GEF domain-containing protein n=1 Tax=Entamoeba dispar (strain ATCC PRA-260 / SAW760) TaxID=370354 RepID=B0EKL1_ENTDS|nr:uncharacterized protein EDI_038400 [Entamoeba dispar SAW760]EDR24936.1 hypothetical protein EDI_038400 [Entamoeba dispar SAW760]|eukprot:EDR24936.1 hypothetical protein EDI_038400 [Entamoeba dispar SAW760]
MLTFSELKRSPEFVNESSIEPVHRIVSKQKRSFDIVIDDSSRTDFYPLKTPDSEKSIINHSNSIIQQEFKIPHRGKGSSKNSSLLSHINECSIYDLSLDSISSSTNNSLIKSSGSTPSPKTLSICNTDSFISTPKTTGGTESPISDIKITTRTINEKDQCKKKLRRFSEDLDGEKRINIKKINSISPIFSKEKIKGIKSADDIKRKNRKSNRNVFGDKNLIVEIILDMIKQEYKIEEISKFFFENDFCLIQDESKCNYNDFRMVVWGFDQNIREIFKKLCFIVSQKKNGVGILMEMCFNHKHLLLPYCELFIKNVLNQLEIVFNPNGDPLYNENGEIEEITKEKFIEIVFDQPKGKIYVDSFIYSFPLFLTKKEFIDLIIKQHKRLKDLIHFHHLMEEKVNLLQTVIEQIVSTIINIIDLDIKEKKLFECFNDEIYSLSFINQIKIQLTKQNSIQFQTKDELVLSKGFIITGNNPKTKSKKKLFDITLLDINNYQKLPPKILAKQLILFDWRMTENINVNNIIKFEENENINEWIHLVKRITKKLMKLITKKKEIKYILKLLEELLIQNEFNFLFTFIRELRNKFNEYPKLAKLDKKYKKLYDKLSSLFNYDNNYYEYKRIFNELPHLSLKIPVIEIWKHEMKIQSSITLFFDNKLNMIKIIEVARLIHQIISLKIIHFDITPIPEIQSFLLL